MENENVIVSGIEDSPYTVQLEGLAVVIEDVYATFDPFQKIADIALEVKQ